MSPKKGKRRNRGGQDQREQAPAALPLVAEPEASTGPQEERLPLPRMPDGFDIDDFLFSKLYKSVIVEGQRTMSAVVRAMYRRRVGPEAPSYTLQQFLTEVMKISNRKVDTIITRLDKHLLEENLLTGDFDVSCAIRLLEKVFCDEYSRLNEHCQAQVHYLREIRNSLSHHYPISHLGPEPQEEKLLNLLRDNMEYVFLQQDIEKVEKDLETDPVELKKLHDYIEKKRKQKDVIVRIEKVKIVLEDILEGVNLIMEEEDFTECLSTMRQNLTEISKAKVQIYSMNTYMEDVRRFLSDPRDKLISEGRKELKKHYSKLRLANPCPWMVRDEIDNSAIRKFSIDKIYTPLKIEGSKDEISVERLFLLMKNVRQPEVPPILVLHGLAGCGKTTLCCYLLYSWVENTLEICTLESFNLVIMVELRKVSSNTLEEYLQEQRMPKATAGIPKEELSWLLKDLKLLIIIDGYDEAKESSRRLVKDIFLKFPEQRILVTTRGEFRREVELVATKQHVDYLTVEICGFDDSRIEEFSRKVFRVMNYGPSLCKERTSKFLKYVQGRGRILKKHLELPLTLALMIYLWIDDPTALNNVTTSTSLYYQLFWLCQKKLQERIRERCGRSYNKAFSDEKLLLFVGEKAWELLEKDETVMSYEDEKEVIEKCKEWSVLEGEELLSAFLLCESDDDSGSDNHCYSFLHKTQMEYLAAYYLADETEKHQSLHDALKAETETSWLKFHEVILFLTGHLARKKILPKHLSYILKLVDKAGVEGNNFNFWWKFYIESEDNFTVATIICKTKLSQSVWKLDHHQVVSGLELLCLPAAQIEELDIEIGNGTDPYDIKDLLDIMLNLKHKLRKRYNKQNPLLVQLHFWHHVENSCDCPSNLLLSTLHPWGHLINFTGALEAAEPTKDTLRFCFKVKNLRLRISTPEALAYLGTSLQKIHRNIRQLRVTLALSHKCDPATLTDLIHSQFKGDLELTLPNMTDGDTAWIVQVVKRVSGRHGCNRLFLDSSTLSVHVVLRLMMNLRDVVLHKLTIRSTHDPTAEQMMELEKQEHCTHMKIEWL